MAFAGCGKTPPPSFRFNLVEWTKQERLHLSDDEHFDEGFKEEIGTILTALFGTPDDPKFPFLLGDEDPAHEMIKLDNLQRAAGAVQSDRRATPSGLYREHCVHCHGVTGGGGGPTAALLNPYPRDFRQSRFKFKSTPRRQPPTNHDLKTILRNGIPGTAMPSFQALSSEELDALVDYVKYLTIRGQFERFLLSEVPALDGLSIVDLSLVKETEDGLSPSEDDLEEFKDQLNTYIGKGLVKGIISRWIKPETKSTAVPPAPREFDPAHENHALFVDQGRELFFAKGNCMQCHGETGVGDGQLSNFDDWTEDWRVGNVDFSKPETFKAFIDAGALPPRPIRPRNLTHPVYRGGSHPDDLYLRLANGIEGTPMPSSSAMTSDETWAVVAYVQSLPYANRKSANRKSANRKSANRKSANRKSKTQPFNEQQVTK